MPAMMMPHLVSQDVGVQCAGVMGVTDGVHTRDTLTYTNLGVYSCPPAWPNKVWTSTALHTYLSTQGSNTEPLRARRRVRNGGIARGAMLAASPCWLLT